MRSLFVYISIVMFSLSYLKASDVGEGRDVQKNTSKYSGIFQSIESAASKMSTEQKELLRKEISDMFPKKQEKGFSAYTMSSCEGLLCKNPSSDDETSLDKLIDFSKKRPLATTPSSPLESKNIFEKEKN